jgi:hypothetical protein
MNAPWQLLMKSAARSASGYRYHRSHAQAATRILKSLEGRYGKSSPATIRRADAYAREVLGHVRYAPWLYVYAAFARTFKEGWIPDNYYGAVVVPQMKGWYGQISNLKGLTNRIFRSESFPDVACYLNGLFIAPDDRVVAPRDIAAILFRDAERVAFKADHSIQGKGIFFFDRARFDVAKVAALGNGVFQSYIDQHAVFEQFSPNSVATLRITSAVDDAGKVSVRACYLRLGRSADTHVQSKSHVRVPIDMATGEFGSQAYLTNWLPVEEHPDSRLRFAGQRVPAFAECLVTVTALHAKVPFARCVGWDIAVDRDGRVRLMEWNAEHNDIKFSEASQGPCFRDLHWERLVRTA